MTTAANIIQAAYREGNLIPSGTSPTTSEQSEALDALNRYIDGIFGYELGENLGDWIIPAPQRTAPIAANYPQLPYPTDTSGDIWPLPFANTPSQNIYPYPPANSRLIWGGITMTAYFPENPADGAVMELIVGSGANDGATIAAVLTLDGNGRTIGGTNTQTFTWPIITAMPAGRWMYRADLGNWEPLVDLASSDNLPFPRAYDDFFICALALRIAPRYNKIVSSETEKTAVRTLSRLVARYKQTQSTVYGSQEFPRSLQSYISGRWWW